MQIKEPQMRPIGRPFCKDQIIYLLSKNNGQMTRYELRQQLILMNYGAEGIRQALLNLIAKRIIKTEGSSKAPKNRRIH